MCDREWEVIEWLRGGRLDPELQAHAGECASCTELIDFAGALLDDRRTLMREAQLPDSGLVWWRTRARARQEAAHRAMIGARIVQASLVILAIIAAVAWIGPERSPVDFHAVLTAMTGFAIPMLGVCTLLILAPVAVYFVFSEE